MAGCKEEEQEEEGGHTSNNNAMGRPGVEWQDHPDKMLPRGLVGKGSVEVRAGDREEDTSREVAGGLEQNLKPISSLVGPWSWQWRAANAR